MSYIKNITGSSHKGKIFEKTYTYCNEAYKTGDGKYTASFGCLDSDPLGSMLSVKKMYHKERGRQFEHSMLSVSPVGNDYTNERLLQIGTECAEYWYKKGFQCTVALHLDSEFRHFHILVNSVSYKDGKKLKMNLKFYNEYKTHCSRVLNKYGLDPIRTPAAKIIDSTPHNFYDDLGFLEAYDEIMNDNAACLMEMIEQAPSLGYTPAITEEESVRWTNPDYPTGGYNRFMGYNSKVYREYWSIGRNDHRRSICNGSCFEPNKICPISSPGKDDFLPPPIIIRDSSLESNDNDEYYFSENGALLRINCRREYELNIPDGYTEEQVRKIVDSLPRISDDDKNKLTKRATAASGTLKRHRIDGQVELDLSETIKFNWSDGTSTTIPRSVTSDKDDIAEVIDVNVEEID